jgi:hypothetical protein
LRLIQWIDTGCDNLRIQRIKFRFQLFEAD